jgi:hypothetical protein
MDGPGNRAWKRGMAAKKREAKKRREREAAAAAAARERRWKALAMDLRDKEAGGALGGALHRAGRAIMTLAEEEAQRRSFAYGNASIGNPEVTREVIDEAAAALDKERKEKQDARSRESTVPSPADVQPDWSKKCSTCGATPVVPITGLCGPCTFGDASTAGGNW